MSTKIDRARAILAGSTGPMTAARIAHILRSAGFGPSDALIAELLKPKAPKKAKAKVIDNG